MTSFVAYKCPYRDIYRQVIIEKSFLENLQISSEQLKRRLKIRGAAGAFRSKPVAETLSYMEMYLVLEPSHAHPSITSYRCLPEMRETLKQFLLEQDLCPKH